MPAGVDAHAEAAVARCLRGAAFRNFFALARDEFAAMARPDWRPLALLGALGSIVLKWSAHECACLACGFSVGARGAGHMPLPACVHALAWQEACDAITSGERGGTDARWR